MATLIGQYSVKTSLHASFVEIVKNHSGHTSSAGAKLSARWRADISPRCKCYLAGATPQNLICLVTFASSLHIDPKAGCGFTHFVAQAVTAADASGAAHGAGVSKPPSRVSHPRQTPPRLA